MKKYMYLQYDSDNDFDNDSDKIFVETNTGWYSMDFIKEDEEFTPQTYFRFLVSDSFKDKRHGLEIKSLYKYGHSDAYKWSVTLKWGDVTKFLYEFKSTDNKLSPEYIDDVIIPKVERDFLPRLFKSYFEDIRLMLKYSENKVDIEL